MTEMNESKIQTRARILHRISILKSIKVVSDSDIEKAIESLADVKDKDFLCNIILKEIDGSIVYFDGILAILAMNVANKSVEKCVFEYLNNKTTSDTKKMFLINLLTQMGKPVDSALVHAYVNNPDEVIDSETEKFLKMAEIDPEAQIDFLDFYFGVNKADRAVLLDSIISDYEGDMLANILSPLIYSLDDSDVLKKCIRAFLKSRSYLSYPALNWLIKTSSDDSVVSLCKKTINELKIAGLRKDISLLDYFKDKLKDSKPLAFWVSLLDGNSNFSLVFAREDDDGAVSTFFTVLNPNCGIVSCFGLSRISKLEFVEVLKRFFTGVEIVKLNCDIGVSLLNMLFDTECENEQGTPYEFLCWRQLTYDIEPLEFGFKEYMKSSLKILPVSEVDFKRVSKSDILSSWFYRYSESDCEFKTLIDSICSLNKNDFFEFENLTEQFVKDISENKIQSTVLLKLKRRILFQSYLLNEGDFKNLAHTLYSIGENDKMLVRFFAIIIKKSVYEFFQNLLCAHKSADEKNIFQRQNKIKYSNFDALAMIKMIEEKWVK